MTERRRTDREGNRSSAGSPRSFPATIRGRRTIAAALLAAVLPFVLACGSGGEPASAETIELGREIYAASCASCHGERGEGQPDWQQQLPDLTYPAPPHDATGHTWHHGDGTLFAIIRDGGSQYDSASFRSAMPAFGEVLTDEEILAVLAYLKTLWGDGERRMQAEQSEADPAPIPRAP